MSESALLHATRLHLGKKPDLLLFRNQAGSVQVDGRWQTYGLHRGASDLIGCLRVMIDESDGQHQPVQFGLFFALEIKKLGKVPTAEQQAFIELIRKFGGYADYADSIESAERHYVAAGGAFHV